MKDGQHICLSKIKPLGWWLTCLKSKTTHQLYVDENPSSLNIFEVISSWGTSQIAISFKPLWLMMLKTPPPPTICCDSKKCLVQLWHSPRLQTPSDLSVNTLVIMSLTSSFPFNSSLHFRSILISCHPVIVQSCCLTTPIHYIIPFADTGQDKELL